MLIPDKKKIATIIVGKMGSDDTSEQKPEESMMDDGLHQCGVDLLHAIDNKSPSGIAEAFRAAYSILDSDDSESDEPY